MRRIAAAALCCLIGASAAPAWADPAPRIDSGFFGRLGFGMNWLRDLVAIEVADADDTTGVVAGKGLSVHLELGWVPTPGMVIGFFVANDNAGDSDVDFGDTEVIGTPSAYLANLGLFLSYYPVATSGWYVTGGAGVGVALSVALDEASLDPDLADPDEASGVGAFFAGGYDWRLGNKWALGASARIQVINGEDSAMSVVRHRSVGFALLGSLSFN